MKKLKKHIDLTDVKSKIRSVWAINPVTRRKESKKAYNRKRREKDDWGSGT